MPDSPSGASFQPDSLQQLESADPAAGIPLIDPPDASPTGDAALSFPLEVPPGRLGMAPDLEITYDSRGGDGWLGMGWDLSVPAVEVDTRFGVPRYDPDRETETYRLDGALLAPEAVRAAPVARSPERVFHRRVEGGFERIVRHGSRPRRLLVGGHRQGRRPLDLRPERRGPPGRLPGRRQRLPLVPGAGHRPPRQQRGLPLCPRPQGPGHGR